MGKIGVKDYISWFIGVLAIVVALILGHRNKQLENQQQNIHNSAQTIQLYITNNNYALPPDITKELNNIAIASGDTVHFNVPH